ncbi:MAG: DNA polymerase III subunit alpha [Candidatus Gracilibacteria bacterium]|nr:DNA polymerase III subunit alpha [Candidatus Gracilibacteria bacterium]
MSFVHLHTHTHYTFQRALGDPVKLAKRAKELEQNAIAITDAGNLYGAFEFYRACQDLGVKPIIGVEFQISKKGRANRDKDNELYEIVLLAKNHAGYLNLISLVTRSQMEGYYNGRPRIDFELLEEYASDIIALSGSMYGEIGQMIITGKDESFICERIAYYQNLFGKENYFLEIEEHPDKPMQPKINETIIALSKKYGYEYVGTNNTYYMSPDDADVQDMMMAVSDGRSLDDPDRNTLMNGDYSIRPSREMEELFVYTPRAYENAQKIADMIDIQIEYGSYKIPKFPLSIEEKEKYEKYGLFISSENERNDLKFQALSEEEWLLRTMCIDGLNFRYEFGLSESQKSILLHKIAIPKPEKKLSAMSVEELYTLAESYYSDSKKEIVSSLPDEKKSILRRLEYELAVVDIMGFNGYFCIVADFIRYGKNNGVPVGPGRGSAAGAILAYLSGITDIDPLRYGLLFERFLNPSRVSMPDIDVDFSDGGRDKVLAYVREKYGKDHVAQVCTFGTLAARAAVKDSGRALGIPFQEMNDFAKLIPARPGITLKEALEEAVEFKEAYDTEDKYRKVVDAALKLEGSVRQLGVHACAVIIAPEPMTHFCPLQPPPKDPTSTVTQFSAHPLEDLGLLKMDFLGLRNLSILSRAVEIVEEVHGVKIDLLKIDYEDPKVLALFGEGDMTGVFQFESSGMRRYLKDLKPSSFEDLIAMVSLYRPGPLQYIPEFIDRKFGRKKVEYPHPSLESILKPTYGIAVYQEQIMQLVQAFAGFSLGEADILRRAIGKKKYELLMEQRGKFIDAAKVQGHPEELAIYIFDEIIEPFAGYGFNKSHAACYSMIAYQTAYMKTYYPTESMTALMISDEEDTDRIRMEIEEARAKKVQILPPDVNESRRHFTFIDATHIRFGLQAIKGLGEGPIETIRAAVREKKFTSIYDFIERTGGDVINKKSLESLILSGALDAFGDRARLMASITKMSAYQKEIEAKKQTSQMGLFDMGAQDGGTVVHFELEKAEPMTFEARMKGEKSIIGYPVSGHPLDGIEEFVKAKSKNIHLIYDWIESKANGVEVEGGEIVDIEVAPEVKTPSEEGEIPSPTPDDSDIPPVPESDEIIEAPVVEKAKEENVFATLIGLVHDVRKMQTKSGGMMLMATVESVGFDFKLVIFPRDYETYENKVVEDMIVVVDGRLRFDTERDEVSISPGAAFGKKRGDSAGSIKSFSISQFHQFAGKQEEKQLARNEDGTIQLDASGVALEDNRYFIDVPGYWTKDDLLDLRDYLTKADVGLVPVWIRVNGMEKNTKFTIQDIEGLKEWVQKKGV